MTDVSIFRVFTNDKGDFGDVASVIIDEGKHITDTERQAITCELNTCETIFVNNLAKSEISVIHPQGEIGFAGVGVLAVARLLARLSGEPITEIQSRDGAIATWQENGFTWAQASLSIMPPWNYEQLKSAETVENIVLEETRTLEHVMMWAWMDESKGLMRARTFANDWDIPEAQGNGSGSMMLAAKLGRNIRIKHGRGSEILAKPVSNNSVAIGGRVLEVPRIA
jgi:predicted PhzF superfamily epimerase YddE/YHI9